MSSSSGEVPTPGPLQPVGDAGELSRFNPFDPAILAQPWEYNDRLVAEAPVHREPNTGLILVSSYELVNQVLNDYETFSNRFMLMMGGGTKAKVPSAVAEVMKGGYPPVDTMLTADPPEQRRFRSLVNKGFSLRRVGALAPRIEALVGELIDGFAQEGRVELRSQFAVPLPLTVIAEQLGVPREDLAKFKQWSDGFVAQLGGMASTEEQVEAWKRIVEFQRYFEKVLKDRAENPRADILSAVVNARVEGEASLDTAECLSILQQLLVAGNETTASAICQGVHLLMENPDQLARLRENPDGIPNAVEEILRLTTPTANMWRVCIRDTVLGGVEIAAGSAMLVRFSAANRDPAVFPDPHAFDAGRANAHDHLAFGAGVHFCLGAQLARMEMTKAFEALLERLPNLRAPDGSGPPVYPPNILLRGMAALPLEFDPA
ncbi:MAG TPA: cytochrome P450 [Myxococcales bacterium]|nr:cytochrome P450 [Myxococcales bacterium]